MSEPSSNVLNPVGKIAEKAVCRSVFALLQTVFLSISPTGNKPLLYMNWWNYLFNGLLNSVLF